MVCSCHTYNPDVFYPLLIWDVLADVLKARLKTTGVVEHTFLVNSGSHRGVPWRIYDVGGARGQRPAWAPYFEHGEPCRK